MKRHSLTISLLVAASVAVSSAIGQENQEVLKKRLLAEYPAALKSWEAQFSRAVVKVKRTSKSGTKKTDQDRDIVFSLKCKLPGKAVMISASSRDGAPEQTVSGYNERYSFALRKTGDRSDYSVSSLTATDANGPPRGIPIMETILRVPYACVEPNDHLLSRRGFAVKAVSPLLRGGKNLLRVEFEFGVNDPNRKVPKGRINFGGREGFFVVCPEEKWALYEYECRDKKKDPRVFSFKGSVEYQGTVDGFPIPKRAITQRFNRLSGELIVEETSDFEEFRFAEIPDLEFTLAAFGIPEQVSQAPTVARTGSRGHWFLALAIAALVAAILFKVASSRFRRAPSSG